MADEIQPPSRRGVAYCLLMSPKESAVCTAPASTCPKGSGLIDVWTILYTICYRAILQTAIYIIYYIFSKAAEIIELSHVCMYMILHECMQTLVVFAYYIIATVQYIWFVVPFSIFVILYQCWLVHYKFKHSMEWYVSVYLGYSSLVYSLLYIRPPPAEDCQYYIVMIDDDVILYT